MRANISALSTLRTLQRTQQTPNPEQQAALARWSGWGAVPAVFDPNAAAYERFAWARAELGVLLSRDEFAAAERNTLNAHYTDASYVRAIWGAAHDLGFRGGAVLEPGCGSGNFLAHAPEGSQLIGVELEPVTAALAAALYPHAQVRNESFADTRIPEGTFDLVVGNVPFGDVQLHDKRHNAGSHRIHNHFVIKGLHLTRPGGLMAVITSRYTMDAVNPAARREMSALADLVGAVRLPTGAHRRAAGTDVVTDVLVFRRREAGRAPSGAEFEQSASVTLDGAVDPLRINEYFVAHPEHVLGDMRATQGDRGRAELGVFGERQAGEALQSALTDIVARARESELLLSERTESPTLRTPVALVAPPTRRPDGFLTAHADGSFTQLQDGAEIPHRVPASQVGELRSLLGLRDTAVALLETEAGSIDDSDALDQLRHQLNRQYDQYVSKHGPINRFSERRTGRIDPDTQEERLARIRPPQGKFQEDPFANVVFSLEQFDSATQTAIKAPVFRQRVVARQMPRLGADTPADALSICLDSIGEARIDEIARLLGTSETEARQQLGQLVFEEPGTERLVPAAEYLSGNVRTKLADALSAAKEDARFAPNVDALSAAQPRDLGPAEIHAKLGASWISAPYVQQFLRETLEDPWLQVENPGGSIWAVKAGGGSHVLATSTWGTERCSASHLANALLEQRPIRIYDENKEEGTRTLNAYATAAAVEKASELSARFSDWVWEEPARARALARTYNDRFNAIVPRSYDGMKLSLPGLALTFRPRPHQVAAVARIVHEPAVGLFHEVGAGKTAEMVMGAMELRRLGMATKPAVVVPNHMLEQFAREWLQTYPQAKLLAAGKEDLDRDRRRLFMAKCATGDWDAVIMTRSAFERIPMSQDVQRAYLEREVEAVVSVIDHAKSSGERLTLKRLERLKLQTEERIKKKLDGVKDAGLSFEHLGIDYLFVDEAHAYKNLRTASNIPGMSVDGSQRATDLDMKLGHLRSKHSRVATLATATPVSNSIGEVYTMQRLLRPDLLEEAGITNFDQWGGTFGELVTGIEVAPDGSGMRMKSRFAKFRNVPELLLQWRVSADVKTGEDLKLPIPSLALRASDQQPLPETVVVLPSSELQWFVRELADRAERVRAHEVEPREDNLLSITSDGRAAGLDLRLVKGATEEPQKVDVAATRIAQLYQNNRDNEYPGVNGEPHPRRGALQLVFADLGTPKPGAWSVYEELRQQLVHKGVPRDEVRFVHEARNDREKADLFAACRDGRVSVLIGSTERMGVGTNVQLRAVALHHLDCPWRPADITQREGRILRQGNANPEVRILRYVTEGSFDAYLWQTVTRKAGFIAQVMRGRLDVRELEDVGEFALSCNEVKALATGNPLLLDQAQAQAEVQRLERMQRAHHRSQDTLRHAVVDHGAAIVRLERRIQAADAALGKVTELGDSFRLAVNGRAFSKRPEGNEALRLSVAQLVAHRDFDRPVRLGDLQGFSIQVTVQPKAGQVRLDLGLPDSDIEVKLDELRGAALVTRLENRLRNLATVREEDQKQQGRLRAEIERARAEIGTPFRHAAQLEAERARLQKLDQQLNAFTQPDVSEAPVVATAPAAMSQSDAPLTPVAGPDEADRKARGDALALRWRALLAREVAAVRRQAAAVDKRLEDRLRAHGERLAAHRALEPKRPHALAMLAGARASYDTAVEAWSKELTRLEHCEKLLTQRRVHVLEYRRESVAGCPSRGVQLAVERVRKRDGELARSLDAYREWRSEHSVAQQRAALKAAPAREREDGGLRR